ncbi:MAG: DNA-3-methyladenine glycosylase I [Alphaproteobacteria bacterium]
MSTQHSLITERDRKKRCWWCGNDPLYIRYHDEEWGKPVFDDVRLFEKICLEGFQAGLSWLTILKKRENFRQAFAGFDIHTISAFSQNDVKTLLTNSGIIRHRGKIEATINNARCAIKLLEEYNTLGDYFWSFKPEENTYTPRIHKNDIPTHTAQSKAMSQDLKRRSWRFVGPVTCYAFMQATGMVNDHIKGCHCLK